MLASPRRIRILRQSVDIKTRKVDPVRVRTVSTGFDNSLAEASVDMDTQMLSAATPTGSPPSFCIRSPCSPQIYAERSESAAQLSSLKTLLKIGRSDSSSEYPPGLPRGPGDLRAAAGEHKKVVAGDQVNYQLQEGCKQSCDPRRLSARQPRQQWTDTTETSP